MPESDNNKFNIGNYKRLNRQNNLLFLTGAISLLAGLFFPKIPSLVDLLIIFSLAVSSAVVVICLRCSKSDELTGLPLLAVIAVASLLTATIALTKLLITQNIGLIITLAERLNIINDVLPSSVSAVFFIIASVILLVISAKLTAKLMSNSKTYLEEITAVEQSGKELNSITDDNNQKNLPAREKGFVYAVNSFGRLALWLCVLISIVIIVSIFGAALSGRTAIGFAASTIIVFQLPAVLVVSGLSHLSRKIILLSSRQNRMTEEQFRQRIKVVAHEVALAQMDEQSAEHTLQQMDMADDIILFDCNDYDDDAEYDLMTNMLVESGADKVLLMAGCGTQYTPVTIPVNIAVRFAVRGLKILIVDFDLKRSAVQRVFETDNCDSKAVKTCVENISLISGKRLASAKTDTLRQLFTKAEKLYDYIIVYAPDADVEPQMSEFFTTAVLFGGENTKVNQKLNNLIYELKKTDCLLLKPYDLLQPA